MAGLRIGFDVDDVLIDSADSITRLHNELYGTAVGRDDWYNFASADRWGVADGLAISERVNELIEHEAYCSGAAALPGAQEVLTELKGNGDELFALTGRPERLRRVTLSVLERCFPETFPDDRLYMTGWQANGPESTPSNKVEIAQELELTHFVDDLFVHAKAMAQVGIRVALFSDNYSWNKNDADTAVVRVGSWQHLGEYFDAERRAIV